MGPKLTWTNNRLFRDFSVDIISRQHISWPFLTVFRQILHDCAPKLVLRDFFQESSEVRKLKWVEIWLCRNQEQKHRRVGTPHLTFTYVLVVAYYVTTYDRVFARLTIRMKSPNVCSIGPWCVLLVHVGEWLQVVCIRKLTRQCVHRQPSLSNIRNFWSILSVQAPSEARTLHPAVQMTLLTTPVGKHVPPLPAMSDPSMSDVDVDAW